MKRLEAHFESICEARTAAEALSRAGLGQAYLDLAGALDYEYSHELSAVEINAHAGDGTDHLSALMLGLWSHGLNDIKPVASEPWPVGRNPGECEEGELKISAKLVLKVPDERAETAAGIIRENGGKIFPPML